MKLEYIVLALIIVAGLIFIPPIAQDPTYHDFADKRSLFGISNFADVFSNTAFIIVGINGLLIGTGFSFASITFYSAIILVCIGSSYYHLEPDNETLVWDRLPMAIAFMVLLAIVMKRRINRIYGTIFMQIIFILIGIESVIWWALFDDLKHYILVQFGSIGYALFLLIRHNNQLLCRAIMWYSAAKLLELTDKFVFNLTAHLISGHTLKHLFAAIGTYYAGKYITQKRSKDDCPV